MVPKHLCLLILAVVACTAAQSQDELNIPVENDNQFPPENNSESNDNLVEGSGVGAIEVPVDISTTQASVTLEDVQLPIAADNGQKVSEPEDTSCPKPCVCHTEGGTGDFVVDCSGYELTELPSPIDIKTTILNIQNNQLTEIPKEVSALKNLKILNANDNSIMDLASGSISELPELISLKLGNNRLIEFPQDLKNSFGLIKLKELDLGGNDMRTPLTPEVFTSFIALRNLTLPTATPDLSIDLCSALKNSLEIVCSESCNTQTFECPDAPQISGEDGMISVNLPETNASSGIDGENEDPSVFENTNINLENGETNPEIEDPASPVNENETNPSEFSLRTAVNEAESEGILPLNTSVEAPKAAEEGNSLSDVILPATVLLSSVFDDNVDPFPNTNINLNNIETSSAKEPIQDGANASPAEAKENAKDPNEFSLRTAVNKAESADTSPLSTLVVDPKTADENQNEKIDVAIGATTSATKTGGVDKSIIGMIVAGMVLVVAGITIKKNWSSIKNKFSSSPRPANDRTPHTNGSVPEEVPLQDNKSPV